MDNLIASSEKHYILEGIAQNIRNDGRRRDEYRHIQVASGVVTSANGSAHVRVGSTEVFVGVKCEIGSPDTSRPNEGRVVFSVECSPLASPEFRGRGGDDLAADLSRSLQSILYPAGPGQGGPIDLTSLCITARKTCWVIYVDALVSNIGGGLVDAISIAVRAALADTRLPKVNVITGDDPEGEPELELDDDPSASCPLEIASWPVIVTVSRAGSCYIVDADPLEELCAAARLECVVDPRGRVCGTALGSRDGVDPAALMEMVGVAAAVGPRVIAAVDKRLKIGQ